MSKVTSETIIDQIGDQLRTWGSGLWRQRTMLGSSGIALAIVLSINSALIGPILYKLAMVILFGAIGYYADRSAFHYARPHELQEKANESVRGESASVTQHLAAMQAFNAAQLRRAIIIGAAMLAGAIAV